MRSNSPWWFQFRERKREREILWREVIKRGDIAVSFIRLGFWSRARSPPRTLFIYSTSDLTTYRMGGKVLPIILTVQDRCTSSVAQWISIQRRKSATDCSTPIKRLNCDTIRLYIKWCQRYSYWMRVTSNILPLKCLWNGTHWAMCKHTRE